MHIKHLFPLALALTLGLVGAPFAVADTGHHHTPQAASYGVAGKAASVGRTIRLEASDSMRFSLSDLKIRRGETIRFVITNVGKVRHEFSLGTQKELVEHYEEMKKFPDMVHDEPNKVTVEPGQSGEVIWHFTQPGVVHFACLHPGHYEAGMKGQIRVAKGS